MIFLCKIFQKPHYMVYVCVFVHSHNRELQLLLASKDSILLHGWSRSLLLNTIVGIQLVWFVAQFFILF